MTSPLIVTHCVVEYLYRDAGNWKTYGTELLVGGYSRMRNRAIQDLLGDDCVFVPEQIGLPPLQLIHAVNYGANSGLDHAFHEFVELRPATTADFIAKEPISSAKQLIAAITAANGNWNCSLSPLG